MHPPKPFSTVAAPAVPSARRRPRRITLVGVGAFVLSVLAVAGYALHTYVLSWFGASVETEAPPLPNAALHPGLLGMHVVSGTAALLTGTTQMLAVWRAWRPAVWHRRIGILYVASVGVASMSGLLLAPSAAGGTTGRSGFALLALLWLVTTAVGVQRIMRHDPAGHRRALVRSFALTSAAISLRLQLPLALAIGFEFEQAYPWIAWSCWVPNVILAEVWLRRR